MLKPLKTCLILVLLPGILPAGAQPALPPGLAWNRVDSSDLQPDKVAVLAEKLGLRPLASRPSAGHQGYRGKLELLRPFPLGFQFHAAVPDPGAVSFPAHGSGDGSSYYAIRTEGYTTHGSNLHAFLESAYRQEIDSGYASSLTGREYAARDAGEFHRRMWLSQGYAWQSIARDNPFSGGTAWMWTAHGYAIDALALLFAAAIVGGAIKGPSDWGAYAVGSGAAVGLIALNRLIVMPIGNSHLSNYNRIVRSGYRFPEF